VILSPLELISLISGCIPVLLGLYFFSRLNRALMVFLLSLIIMILVDMAATYLALYGHHNLWLYQILTLAEYGLLMFVLSCWQPDSRVRLVMRLSIVLYAVVWACAKYAVEDFRSMDYFTASLASAVLMGGALYTVYIMSKNPIQRIHRDPRFWILTGMLLYHGGNIFTYAFSQKVMVWSIHNGLNITANLCYAGGFLSLRRSRTFGFLSSGRLPS